MQANRQMTLDDLEPVLNDELNEEVLESSQVQPRTMEALRLYEEMQYLKDAFPEDPLFD